MTYPWQANLDPRPLETYGSLQGICAWTPLEAQLHTKHSTDAVTSLASYNSKPADQPAATLASVNSHDRRRGSAWPDPQDSYAATHPRNLLMLARASCTRCRDCGRRGLGDVTRCRCLSSMPGQIRARPCHAHATGSAILDSCWTSCQVQRAISENPQPHFTLPSQSQLSSQLLLPINSHLPTNQTKLVRL